MIARFQDVGEIPDGLCHKLRSTSAATYVVTRSNMHAFRNHSLLPMHLPYPSLQMTIDVYIGSYFNVHRTPQTLLLKCDFHLELRRNHKAFFFKLSSTPMQCV